MLQRTLRHGARQRLPDKVSEQRRRRDQDGRELPQLRGQTALFWRRNRLASTRITLRAKNGVFLTRNRN